MADRADVPQARLSPANLLENSRRPPAALGRRISGGGSQLADCRFADRGQFFLGLLAGCERVIIELPDQTVDSRRQIGGRLRLLRRCDSCQDQRQRKYPDEINPLKDPDIKSFMDSFRIGK